MRLVLDTAENVQKPRSENVFSVVYSVGWYNSTQINEEGSAGPMKRAIRIQGSRHRGGWERGVLLCDLGFEAKNGLMGL